jgi:uncharacterized protein (DUF58 family)
LNSESLALYRTIRLKTRRKLNTLFVGEYHSAFKGYGLLFDSVREYQYGDDVRNVDWNVSARMNHLFIKEYIEERELSVVLLIDMSASLEFGSGRSKRDLLLEAAMLFLYMAQMNNDRVAALLFTDRVERFLRPKKGKKFVLQVMDEILNFKPEGRGTDISGAVDYLRKVLKKRSVVFVISDFLDQGFLLKLRLLRKRHDIIPVMISDPLEREMRLFGLADFVDLETGKTFLSDAVPEKGNPPGLEEFDAIMLDTATPIELPVLRFFEKRNRTRLTGDQG